MPLPVRKAFSPLPPSSQRRKVSTNQSIVVSRRLDLDGGLDGLALLVLASDGLGTHDTTTPVTLGLLGLLHVSLFDGRNELGELRAVLRADLGDGEDGSGLDTESQFLSFVVHIMSNSAYLLVDDRSETGLALYDGVRDTHLLAECRKEDDELDGIDIVGDEDKRSLLVLNETNNVVETVLDGVRLGRDVLLLLAILDGGGLLGETLLLLGLGLGAVLVEELQGLGGSVAVKDLLELGNRRGDLEAEVQDLTLALKANILGPAHHAREVALGLDVLADTEVARALLDERVLLLVSLFWS